MGDPRRCRRPTARGRSSSRSTCASTRRSSSTATAARAASRSRRTGRSARSRARCWRPSASLGGPVEIDLNAAGDGLDDAARRGRRARDLRPRPGRDVLRGRDPGGARPRGTPRALPRALDPGQRVVGLVRPRREPLLGPARADRRPTTSSCATRWTRRRSPSAGGPAMRATRTPRSTPTHIRHRAGFADADAHAGRRALGRDARRVPPRLGRRRRSRRPARDRARLRRARPSPRAARCASGTPRWPRARSATRRRSPSCSS